MLRAAITAAHRSPNSEAVHPVLLELEPALPHQQAEAALAMARTLASTAARTQGRLRAGRGWCRV
ncbi:hypothetical protein ACU4GD_18915 [Cupriavidus basilensis]